MRALSKASRKITIATLQTAVDDLGGLAESWGGSVSVWAERENIKGKAGVEGEREFNEADAKFTIRHSSTTAGYTPAQQRVTQGGTTFDIVAIVDEPGDRPEVRHLYCKTLV